MTSLPKVPILSQTKHAFTVKEIRATLSPTCNLSSDFPGFYGTISYATKTDGYLFLIFWLLIPEIVPSAVLLIFTATSSSTKKTINLDYVDLKDTLPQRYSDF